MGNLNPRLLQEVTRNIETALKEDEVFKDITSLSCLPEDAQGCAHLIVKENATLAGLPLANLISYSVDPSLKVTLLEEEGSSVKAFAPIATFSGSFRSLLAMERTLINFIQHPTSIATQTAKYVEAVEGKCEILDTRKTLPGYRFLQKYAVAIGGGKNHRFHLGDQILIKDNHLTSLSPKEAIQKARKQYPTKRIQIEVENLEMFASAIQEKPDAILLDNMTPDQIREITSQNISGTYLEASGGIHLQNIRSYADTGVDGISVGKLTHSISAVDMSIEIRRI